VQDARKELEAIKRKEEQDRKRLEEVRGTPKCVLPSADAGLPIQAQAKEARKSGNQVLSHEEKAKQRMSKNGEFDELISALKTGDAFEDDLAKTRRRRSERNNDRPNYLRWVHEMHVDLSDSQMCLGWREQ
jgi:aconitase A